MRRMARSRPSQKRRRGCRGGGVRGGTTGRFAPLPRQCVRVPRRRRRRSAPARSSRNLVPESAPPGLHPQRVMRREGSVERLRTLTPGAPRRTPHASTNSRLHHPPAGRDGGGGGGGGGGVTGVAGNLASLPQFHHVRHGVRLVERVPIPRGLDGATTTRLNRRLPRCSHSSHTVPPPTLIPELKGVNGTLTRHHCIGRREYLGPHATHHSAHRLARRGAPGKASPKALAPRRGVCRVCAALALCRMSPSGKEGPACFFFLFPLLS